MNILPIASSSSGNCTYIGTDKAHILIDVGISVKKIVQATGRKEFDAIIISHEHGDHIKSAGPAGRKFKCPVYMHEWSYKAKQDKFNGVNIVDLNPSDVLKIGDLSIETFSTKHDAKYTFGFLITDTTNKKTLCYVTDTGIITPLMRHYMKGADAYLIETDYDEQMLKDNDQYSEYLKDRIMSAYGHLSNNDALDGLEKIGIDKSSFVIFGHLSDKTNRPDIVLKSAKNKFPLYNGTFYIAPTLDPVELK
jgi:phosphoribosyl 1,2-cyclic phosphodiesterase